MIHGINGTNKLTITTNRSSHLIHTSIHLTGVGLYSGINPDTPRNLAKAVTVD